MNREKYVLLFLESPMELSGLEYMHHLPMSSVLWYGRVGRDSQEYGLLQPEQLEEAEMSSSSMLDALVRQNQDWQSTSDSDRLLWANGLFGRIIPDLTEML